MTSYKELAYKLRHLILVVGILFTLGGLVWIFSPLLIEEMGLLGTVLALPGSGNNIIVYSVNAILIVGILVTLQWAYLRPCKKSGVSLITEGKPLKTSIFIAAVMAMLLSIGMISLILEIPNWWADIIDSDKLFIRLTIYVTMLIIWGIWALIFFIYWKQGNRYTQLGKMIRGLIAGSILEFFIAVPIHIWATRQRDCYCLRGTYTTLILAGTVLIWAFGPGIILLYLREKYRREKLLDPQNQMSHSDNGQNQDDTK